MRWSIVVVVTDRSGGGSVVVVGRRRRRRRLQKQVMLARRRPKLLWVCVCARARQTQTAAGKWRTVIDAHRWPRVASPPDNSAICRSFVIFPPFDRLNDFKIHKYICIIKTFVNLYRIRQGRTYLFLRCDCSFLVLTAHHCIIICCIFGLWEKWSVYLTEKFIFMIHFENFAFWT